MDYKYDKRSLITLNERNNSSKSVENNGIKNNFFFSLNKNCCCDTSEQRNQGINAEKKRSIIHFNGRSLWTKFQVIKEADSFLLPFRVTAISEPRINWDKGTDVQLDEFRFINQQNKGGGLESLLVDKNLKFKVLVETIAGINNALERITVEICKQIKIPPASSIETSKDQNLTILCHSYKQFTVFAGV